MATIDEFRAMLATMPADEREAFLRSLVSDYAGEGEVLQEQAAYADELRGTPGPQMRRAGRLSVASHPLEHLATAGRRGLGEYEAVQARNARREQSKRKEEALATMLRNMTAPPPAAAGGAPAMSPVAPAPSPIAAMLRR